MRWTDNHCHLDPDAADEVVSEALTAGVERLVDVGTDVASSRRAIALAGRHGGVWATAGIHPHEAEAGSGDLAELEALLVEPGVVAVGEAGLDYHYDHSPRPRQREMFAAQIGLAHDHDLPLVIHAREAWADVFAVLDTEGVPTRTVFHCFTGGLAEADSALERGCFLSFSGIVTFKAADELRAAARRCPLERLMVETDAPYLAPVPHRGHTNRPAWVVHVGETLARVCGVSPAELADRTWRSAEEFYGLG